MVFRLLGKLLYISTPLKLILNFLRFVLVLILFAFFYVTEAENHICYRGYKSQLKNEVVSVVCLTHLFGPTRVSLISEL